MKRPRTATALDSRKTEGVTGPAAPALSRGLLRPLESLRYPGYRIFWLGMFLVFSSMQMNMIARQWYMYRLTHSAVLLGVLGVGSAVPMLALSLFGGTLADRIQKRYIILYGQAVLTIMSIALGFIVTSGVIQWWHLVAAGAFQGLATAFLMPARQSIVAELVPRPHLLNAVSLSAAEMNANRMVAPAIGGFLIAAMGIQYVFFLMAVLTAVAFVITLFLPPTRPVARPPGRTVLKDMGEAFTYIRGRPIIRNLLVVAFVTVLFGMPMQLLLPIFSEDVLNVGPQGLGMLMSLMGVGALMGSIITASMGDYQRKGLLLILATIVFGVGIVAFAFSPLSLLSLILIVPAGLGWSGRMTVNNTLLQAHVDDDMRGRVMAIYMMEMGFQPLGSMPIAFAAEAFGAPLAVGAAGAVVAVYGLWMLFFQPAVRRLH
ncbi:MAG: MFS transporter [Chloroflexi bacterium]|nr:MFS transporter [Chloroflexota bacterium]